MKFKTINKILKEMYLRKKNKLKEDRFLKRWKALIYIILLKEYISTDFLMNEIFSIYRSQKYNIWTPVGIK